MKKANWNGCRRHTKPSTGSPVLWNLDFNLHAANGRLRVEKRCHPLSVLRRGGAPGPVYQQAEPHGEVVCHGGMTGPGHQVGCQRALTSDGQEIHLGQGPHHLQWKAWVKDSNARVRMWFLSFQKTMDQPRAQHSNDNANLLSALT